MSESEKEYHFSLGNSTQGPIGYCAVVIATSTEQAVERLKEILWAELPQAGIPCTQNLLERMPDRRPGEYLVAYINPRKVTKQNIDEIRPLEDKDK